MAEGLLNVHVVQSLISRTEKCQEPPLMVDRSQQRMYRVDRVEREPGHDGQETLAA